MKFPIISVIIPIYKVEAYLDRCITSVSHQTYSNLEIILVDDGSPDDCPAICDEWLKKDSRIKVIHKENGGLSSARNAGLDACCGEYVAFIDSDDWIEPEMYEVLLSECIENNTLMSVGGRFDVYEYNDIQKEGRSPKESRVIDIESALDLMFSGREMDSAACDKLFHRSWWSDIRFPEGKVYEDIAIMYKLIIKAGRIALINKRFYNYFHRDGSIVTSKFSVALVDYPNHTRKILEFISKNYPECIDSATYAHVQALSYLVSKVIKSEKISRDVMCKKLYLVHARELRSYAKFYLKSSLFSKKEKVLFIILSNRILSSILRFLKNK